MGRRRVNIKADRDSLQSQAESCHGQCRVQMSDVRDTVVYTYSRVRLSALRDSAESLGQRCDTFL